MERDSIHRGGRGLVVGALCLTTAPAFANEPAGDPAPLGPPEVPAPEAEAEWGWSYEAGEGLTFASADGENGVSVGGRIMNDWAWMTADDGTKGIDPMNPFVDGTEFRRAWLELSGTLHDNVHFKASYELANSSVGFRDVYMGLDDVIATTDFQVGSMKEPFSLEELTSSKYITFMERSLVNSMAPAYNTGAQLADFYPDSNFNWAFGVFRDSNNEGASAQVKDGGYNLTGRVAWAPVLSDDASSVVHIGLAASARNPEGTSRIRTRPENHLAPYVLDSMAVAADDATHYGAEAAWVNGPLSLQAEYVMAEIAQTAGGPDVEATGFYAFVSYFLTGEMRPYKADGATFGRVKPNHSYGEDGSGAWEAAARFSSLEIDDAPGGMGGQLDDVTLGMNWYLNPNARVMFNYVWGDLDSDTDAFDGDINSFMMRFQVDF